MKIEHITLGGNSAIRDSEDILLETINLLRDFKIKNTSKILPFPMTDFYVKVTATDEGAMFDIMKGENIAFTNICSFNETQAKALYPHIKKLSQYSFLKSDIFRTPDLPQYIYTIAVNPFVLTPEEMQTAGEIELYIYYMLYLAQV